MPFLQLTVIGLAWHAFGLFSNDQRTVLEKIAAGEFNKEVSIIAVTGAGVVVAFMIQRMVRNRGPYHVNQFRIYFTVEDRSVTASMLASKLRTNFHKAFANNRVARVCKPFPESPDIIQFSVVLWRAKLFKYLMGKDRQEHVKLSDPAPSDAAFQARTLRIAGASAADWHFLSGVRSWCIAQTEQCENYGEPVPLSDNTFVLETAALEEFSFWTYEKLLGRKHIKMTWRDFLVDAIAQLEVAVVVPTKCKESGLQKPYQLGSSIWEKKSAWKWRRGGPRNQIWERESAYSRRKIALLEREAYASRLFSLHPGLEREYKSLFE